MTSRQLLRERPHLTAHSAPSKPKGRTRPRHYEMGDEFPCGLLGFHLVILTSGMETFPRMDLYDRRFTIGDRRARLRGLFDGWITRHISHAPEAQNELGLLRVLHNHDSGVCNNACNWKAARQPTRLYNLFHYPPRSSLVKDKRKTHGYV